MKIFVRLFFIGGYNMPVFALTSRPLNQILQARDLGIRRMRSGQVQPKKNIISNPHSKNNSPNVKSTHVATMANIITPPPNIPKSLPKPLKKPNYIF